MRTSWCIFRIFGIDIRIDSSWIFIFGLITWALAGHYFPSQYPRWPYWQYWGVGIAASVLLFAVLGEEWHTAEAMSRISDLLYYEGLRDKAVMFWNANNTYGFERINWARLSFAITITTVSKYMKHIMRNWGINPLVIPNGIPSEILEEVDEVHVMRLKGLMDTDFIVSEVASR